MISTRLLLAAALVMAPPLAAFAQGPDNGGPPSDSSGQGHRGPPPEAIAACKGKAVGTQASFTDRSGRTVTGACTQMGDVVAVPPPHGGHGPQDAASRSTR
jgi:hypothetical protein